ncbi:MAG: maleylpyruvate isomerase family mycothiol-dependent enzyme [Micropruina sp.]|nr:maleylpyruvate isomerase family mycothiol-dependent enzyme [Micropruina sp.]
MDVVGRNLVGRDLVELQRERCCDVLESVPPDAPTLCEGWTAFDLAAHLDALCRDPLSWPGIGLRALAPITTRRAERLQRRLGYDGLIRRLRRRSPVIPLFGADPVQGWLHHLGEWYVHTEDVRRPNGLPGARRDPPMDEALWLRVQVAARILCRRDRRGLTLRLPDGRTARVHDRPEPRVVTGAPGELMVHVYRGRAATVTIADPGR